MDRTEWFLALIVYLLASIMYTIGDQNTPIIITYYTLILIHLFPTYIIFDIIITSEKDDSMFSKRYKSKDDN